MIITNKIRPVSWSILLLLLAACSKSPDPNTDSSFFSDYDQSGLLSNLGNEVLLNPIKNIVEDATALSDGIHVFTENPTIESLTQAQEAWEKVALDWGHVAPFGFGPLNEQLIAVNVDNWPANPNKIETAIQNQSAADVIGADAKGLKGLEYLLFNGGAQETVLNSYAGTNGGRRKAYLISVADNLLKQLTTLRDGWTGGYVSSFTSAKGNNVNSAVGLTVNAISLYLDVVKNMKIGNAIGMGIKINDNQAHPDQIEYKLDEESLAVMKENMLAMKEAFDGGTGQGLDDLLNYVKAQKDGKNLSTVVDAQFDEVIQELNAIQTPYAEAVSDQKQQLQGIFNSLKILIAYFKVDVANNLGVTITFSDTDGD